MVIIQLEIYFPPMLFCKYKIPLQNYEGGYHEKSTINMRRLSLQRLHGTENAPGGQEEGT